MPKRYSPEFRRKVLDLVKEGRPIAEVASDLGVTASSIYVWRRQEQIDSGQRPGLSSSVRAVVAIIMAWAAPVLVMPPLFSRDVYSYAAQGEMVSRGLNPYFYGPTALGPNPFLRLVDPIWQNARAPYGPGWERLAGAIVQVTRHDVVATIIGFRLVALIGVALIAWGVPVLARSVGRDFATALAMAVLNPLVLLVLLGGAHNDALMLGLLVAGCSAARRNHIRVGLALCALAAEVKVPALIGALFIGWWWSDGFASWRQRVPRVVGAVLIAAGLMVVVGLVSGLGWRWVDGLSNPGVVVSWADPVTAVGLALSRASGGWALVDTLSDTYKPLGEWGWRWLQSSPSV